MGPISIHKKWSSERLSHLPNATQIKCGRTGTGTQTARPTAHPDYNLQAARRRGL